MPVTLSCTAWNNGEHVDPGSLPIQDGFRNQPQSDTMSYRRSTTGLCVGPFPVFFAH